MLIIRTAAVIAVVLSSTACGIGQAHNNGPTIERAYSIAAFHELTVAGPYEVNVSATGKPGVTAHGSQEALDDLTVEVVDGDLRVMPKKKHGMRWGWHHDGKVVLTVTGGLQSSKRPSPDRAGSTSTAPAGRASKAASRDRALSTLARLRHSRPSCRSQARATFAPRDGRASYRSTLPGRGTSMCPRCNRPTPTSPSPVPAISAATPAVLPTSPSWGRVTWS